MPWWWCPPGFGLAALIAYEVNLGIRSLPDWLPFAVLLPVAAAALIWLGRIDVRVVSTSTATGATPSCGSGPRTCR